MPDVRCYATACKHNSATIGNDSRAGWCKAEYIYLTVREDTLDSYTDCQIFEDDKSKKLVSEKEREDMLKDDNF